MKRTRILWIVGFVVCCLIGAALGYVIGRAPRPLPAIIFLAGICIGFLGAMSFMAFAIVWSVRPVAAAHAIGRTVHNLVAIAVIACGLAGALLIAYAR